MPSKSHYGVIGLEEVEISCIIGERPEERTTPQQIIIAFCVAVDFARCAKHDDMADAVDYTLLLKAVREIAEQGNFNLIETLAWNILHHFQTHFGIPWAWIKIRKPYALPGLGVPFAEFEVGSKP